MHAPGIRFIRCGALATLIATAGATSAVAQAPASDAAQACIYQPNIDHTRILDDRNILFFTRDRRTYQNTLKDQCYSLKIVNRFTYGEAPMHRLCTGNLIAVLHDLTPGGVTRNNLCRLGMFVPVDDDVVDDLIAAADPSRKTRGRSITAAPVSLPAATESRPDAIEPPAQPQPAPAAAPVPASPEPSR